MPGSLCLHLCAISILHRQYRVLRQWAQDRFSCRSLEQRRAILGAASIQQLCKSMVMVNTRAATDTQRHFLIIIQVPQTSCEHERTCS